MSRAERGFTLIELLVVILIIAILAAVAIAVFLRQREKGWETQMRSSLRDGITAIEAYAMDTDVNPGGGYASLNADPQLDDRLATQGFRFPEWALADDTNVAYFRVRARFDAYCIWARHPNLSSSSDWRRSTVWSEGAPSGPYAGRTTPVPQPDDCSAF